MSANTIFSELIQTNQLIGDSFSIDYEFSKVLVHENLRNEVGGIPNLCFLIATRIDLNAPISYTDEDASIILLRVVGNASIPQDKEAEKVRVETAQRFSGEPEKLWDREGMDGKTRYLLGYAGISCRIIGTFYIDENKSSSELELKFGTDISNFYPNRGLKVYKPNGRALEKIVNYIDGSSLLSHEEEFGSAEPVEFGRVRYASTHRKYQGIENVPTLMYPMDLLSQKTALFGMTRTGKSNTTKIIAKSVYELRHTPSPASGMRIGQIIFDPNGEYANENTQDKDGSDNPNALKNIWEVGCSETLPDDRNNYRKKEVVVYGLEPHESDAMGQERKILKLNFHDVNALNQGKNIINSLLENENSQYFRIFNKVAFEEPVKEDFEQEGEFWEELARYLRKTLVYKALLNKAGLKPPVTENPRVKLTSNRFLFSANLRSAMTDVEHKDPKKEMLIKSAAEVLGNQSVSWDSLNDAFLGLFYFLSTKEFSEYNAQSVKKSRYGQGFYDSDLEGILEMFAHSKGANLIGKASAQHSPDEDKDYAEEIYRDLIDGKLVVVDQSGGDDELNRASAERLMEYIFYKNQNDFRKGERPKDILVYIEEAHNLLPDGKNIDLSDIWVRTAKEGAKYKIGLVYATQEVSSVQRNILKNTANWFIAHLNNTDETKELCKFYDFSDFEPSIRKAQDKGFLRVKTLSSPFVIPVQVDKFELKV